MFWRRDDFQILNTGGGIFVSERDCFIIVMKRTVKVKSCYEKFDIIR